MSDSARVLIAGESWVTHSIHIKGFDCFTTSSYEEGVGWLKKALEASGFEVTYIPNHAAAADFPCTADQMRRYDAIVLSDIGSNTLLLHPATFNRSMPCANRLDALREYVAAGGGFIMIGGYMSFAGIDGKARYSGTPVEEVLPVTISGQDDRAELPQGFRPTVVDPAHPVVSGVSGEWPILLGFNKVVAKPAGRVVVLAEGRSPLIVVGTFEKGRSAVFTSDCAPHWGPPDFVNWAHYPRLWSNLVSWVIGR